MFVVCFCFGLIASIFVVFLLFVFVATEEGWADWLTDCVWFVVVYFVCFVYDDI